MNGKRSVDNTTKSGAGVPIVPLFFIFTYTSHRCMKTRHEHAEPPHIQMGNPHQAPHICVDEVHRRGEGTLLLPSFHFLTHNDPPQVTMTTGPHSLCMAVTTMCPHSPHAAMWTWPHSLRTAMTTAPQSPHSHTACMSNDYNAPQRMHATDSTNAATQPLRQ